jgi:hypothetical protein
VPRKRGCAISDSLLWLRPMISLSSPLPLAAGLLTRGRSGVRRPIALSFRDRLLDSMPPKVAVIPPPARLDACCRTDLTALQPVAYPHWVTDQGSCRKCGWLVFEHPTAAAADAAGAAGAVVPGPSMTLSEDPGRVFEREIEAWKLSAITTSDTDVWQRGFAKLVSVMFDGLSSSCVQTLVRSSGEGVLRKFVLCDLPAGELRVEALKFRSLVSAARTLLGLLRIQARADLFVNGKKPLLIKTLQKTPVGAHVATAILDRGQRDIPGQVIPRASEFASWEFPAWWACMLATTPAQGFCAFVMSIFEDAVQLWADRNRKVVCDELTWNTLHAAAATATGKRADHGDGDGDDGGSRKRRSRGPRAGRRNDTETEPNLNQSPAAAPANTSSGGGRGGRDGGRAGRGRDGRGGGRDGRGGGRDGRGRGRRG